MKAQAHSLRPALSCIVRREKAVRRRFCETGAGVAYLTLHQGLGPLIRSQPSETLRALFAWIKISRISES